MISLFIVFKCCNGVFSPKHLLCFAIDPSYHLLFFHIMFHTDNSFLVRVLCICNSSCFFLFVFSPFNFREYGELLVRFGLIGEAVKIFEDLELWDNVIYCYRYVDT